MEEKSTLISVIESLTSECERLHKENKVLKDKLSVAIEGLKVLVSDGDILGIPQKTLNEIYSLDESLPQNNNVKKEEID